MISVMYTKDMPYPTVCYGCGKKNDENGIRIEAKSPGRLRTEILYLCSECREVLRMELELIDAR